jgi:hypothetical protein
LFLFGCSGLLPQRTFVPPFSTLNLLLIPDNGNSILLWKVGEYLADYMASHTRWYYCLQ